MIYIFYILGELGTNPETKKASYEKMKSYSDLHQTKKMNELGCLLRRVKEI